MTLAERAIALGAVVCVILGAGLAMQEPAEESASPPLAPVTAATEGGGERDKADRDARDDDEDDDDEDRDRGSSPKGGKGNGKGRG